MMKKVNLFKALFLFLSAFSAAHLHGQVNSTHLINLTDIPVVLQPEHLEIFYDPLKTEDINSLTAPGFQGFKPLEKKRLIKQEIGYLVFWLRFTVNNRSTSMENWILSENANFNGKSIELYLLNKKEGVPRKIPPIISKFNEYGFSLNPGQEVSFYLFCKFYDPNLSLELSTASEFYRRRQQHTMFYGFFSGFLLSLAIYSLFLFISMKSYIYINYISYILSMGFYILIINQIGYEFYPNISWTIKGVYISRNLMFIFFMLLVKGFQSQPRKKTVISPIFYGSIIALLIHTGLFLILPITPGTSEIYNISEKILYGVVTVILALVLYYGISLWKQKNSSNKYIGIIAFIFVFMNTLFVLTLLGFTPFTAEDLNHSKFIETCYLFIVLLFSFALSERITQMKKEKEIAQQEAISNLHKADKLKDDFLASTSHELRTPLHSIKGLTDGLLGGTGGELPEAATQQLKLISASSNHLFTLVEDILDFSRIKNNDLSIRLSSMDIYSLTETVILQMQPLLRNKTVKLISNLSRGIPLVEADEDRIQQVLINLIGNAIKFTEIGEITVTAEKQGKYLAVSVRDTGIGISPGDKDRIFEYFVQLQNAEERTSNGLGIGLAISQNIIKLHKGVITLESEKGKGSRFTFTLPLAAEGSEAAPEVSTRTIQAKSTITKHELQFPSERTGKNKILIADDEVINIQIIINHLAGRDYTFFIAENGEEALKIMKSETDIDIVLLDIMMPRLSGYTVCRKIRETYNLFEMPVLMLTAKTQVSDVVAGFQAGANDYLTKPFEKQELLSRVETLHKLKKMTSATEELKRLNNMKTALINLAIHDIKNPLTIIRNSTEKIKETLPPESEGYIFAEKIAQSTKKIINLIDSFLKLSQFQNGNIMLNLEKTDIREIIETSIENLVDLAMNKNQSLLFPDEIKPPCFVMVDRQHFQEVIDNILSNAIKYSPPREEIRICFKELESSSFVRIEVTDNGPGLSDEDKEKIFGRLVHLSAKPTGKESSTGLGLALAKEIVEQHKGVIGVDSTFGQGSTFYVELEKARHQKS